MATPSAREQIAAALAAELPASFLVYPRDASPDQVTRPTVIVRMDSVQPALTIGPDARTYQAGLIVTVPELDPDKYAASLDRALEDLLYALDVAPTLTWGAAKRVTLAGTQTAGYEVGCTVHTTQERITP